MSISSVEQKCHWLRSMTKKNCHWVHLIYPKIFNWSVAAAVVPWPHQRLWLCILFQQLWKVHLPKYTRPQKYDDYWDILSSQNIFPSSRSSSYVYIQPALCMHYTFSYISNIVFKPKSFLLKRQTRRIHKKVLMWTTVDSWSTLCQLLIWMRNHDLASRFGCLQHCVDQMSRTVRMGSPASWSTF